MTSEPVRPRPRSWRRVVRRVLIRAGLLAAVLVLIGYIIPKTEWDREPPFLYDAKKAPYGEVNSVGPEAAGILHSAIREMAAQPPGGNR